MTGSDPLNHTIRKGRTGKMFNQRSMLSCSRTYILDLSVFSCRYECIEYVATENGELEEVEVLDLGIEHADHYEASRIHHGFMQQLIAASVFRLILGALWCRTMGAIFLDDKNE